MKYFPSKMQILTHVLKVGSTLRRLMLSKMIVKKATFYLVQTMHLKCCSKAFKTACPMRTILL